MRHSNGAITLEACDNMYYSEFEYHMILIDAVEEAKQNGIEELAKKGLPGIMMGILMYGQN